MPTYFKNTASEARRLGDGLVQPGEVGVLPDLPPEQGARAHKRVEKIAWLQTQGWELVQKDAEIPAKAEPDAEAAAPVSLEDHAAKPRRFVKRK